MSPSVEPFNEARYKALMDGLECKEIRFKDAVGTSGVPRWDSEYYNKHLIFAEHILKIKTTKKLKELSAFVKKGIFDLSPGLYRNVGIPLIRTSEIKSATINFSSTVFIDEQTHRANAGTQLCPRDIVFTKIGANIGDVALLPDTFDKYNFSQNVVGVSIKDKKLSPYLLMFFLSKTGRAQVMRSVMLSGQGKLELEDIRNYKIPLMSDKFIDAINGIYNRISQNNKKASLLYKQAGQLLSSIIKLDNIARLKENISIKSFSESFGNIGRLDAEYYQPQYEAYKRALHTIDTVSSLCDIHDKNYNPNSEEIYKYIELANVGNSGDISNVELIKGSELPSRARRKVNQGQVIISSVEGSLQSCALITEEFDGALCSTGFYVLTSKSINPETLLVLFKSEIMQALLKQRCSGTILTAITKDELLLMPLPQIDESIQDEIARKVQMSFSFRRQSAQLLEYAKRAVEMAIEQGEDAALVWLKDKVE